MRRRVSPVAVALAFAFAGLSGGDATASGAPRFDLDDSAWQATHVVVATEGQAMDGQLTALETWAGPLAPGDQIHLPRLSPSTLSASRRVHRGLRVTGTRMVLFLDLKHDPASKIWAGESDLHSDAVCWIEEGNVHAMIGRGSRDGPLIGPLRMSELALRARVLRLVEMRDALAALRDTADLDQRLAGTANFVNPDDNYFVQREVFDVLSTCGKAAVPLLVSHLDGRLAFRACRALGAIGDPSAVGPLVQRVERELVFWRDAKQKLADGSWRHASEREAGQYERRVQRLHTLLYTLGRIPSREFEDVVRRTLDLWTAPPELRETPYGHINRACSAALRVVADLERDAK